jgi:hypothetical protein
MMVFGLSQHTLRFCTVKHGVGQHVMSGVPIDI